jgi:hypothetical protein
MVNKQILRFVEEDCIFNYSVFRSTDTERYNFAFCGGAYELIVKLLDRLRTHSNFANCDASNRYVQSWRDYKQ